METKERILRAAQTLFMQRGIKGVSMDDLSADMAVSKKTLYKWFENKDQLVLGVVQQHLGQVQRECCAVADPSANAVAELLAISKWADEQVTNIHPSIFHDLRKYHPAAWALFEDHKKSFILNQIANNLRRGMAEGLFRPDLDVDVLARLSLAQIELAFDPALYPTDRFEPVRVNRVFDEHFLLGVATLKGHRLFNKYRDIVESE